ncbi:MAG: GNAT family N-acetyltransferase [Methanobacterium sp.]|jgi:RimJ/RimL family protein N-acetyltransferase|uniref:GNAT family N-acetyltransferase n=1 Tax=Methanobacterium sp. TaxID=2164 RepID=UPI0025905AE7|nr:GNAT family N-acetyltransferase [Methanobacterium sp.]MCC7559652.1 GNAT family N-acetyltransferase [Methanobacterium sp.]
MIELRKATIKDRKKAYQWLYFSDFSDFLNQLQGYTSDNLPSYKEFQSDYEDYFFTGSQEERGRCYIIVSRKNGKTDDIGIISYTSFHLQGKITEFDIWLKERSCTGHGYGTKAILQLASRIKDMGYDKVIMRPSKHNKMAIRSYKKAGFVEEGLEPASYYLPEYVDEFADGDCGPGGDVFLVLYL